jgi:uncharacterized membrane protein
MNEMEEASTHQRSTNLTRLFIPLAAILVFAFWFSFTPPGLLGKADAIGYAICHRIDERSFHIHDRQLPLCARCTGEFYAAGISLLFFGIFSPRKSGMPGWKLGVPLLFFLAAFGIDGSELLSVFAQGNNGRTAEHTQSLCAK